MKQLTVIHQLHRRRLVALETALKRARADQADLETLLEACCLSEEVTHESGLQLKRNIDSVLFAGTVKRFELDKMQHQLSAAKDALLVARDAVKKARAEVAAAVQRTAEAVLAWRQQAIAVEKFGVFLQGSLEAHQSETLYREEIEREDVYRKRA